MSIAGNQVKIGVSAPRDVAVDRSEIRERKNAGVTAGASFSPANKGEIGGNR